MWAGHFHRPLSLGCRGTNNRAQGADDSRASSRRRAQRPCGHRVPRPTEERSYEYLSDACSSRPLARRRRAVARRMRPGRAAAVRPLRRWQDGPQASPGEGRLRAPSGRVRRGRLAQHGSRAQASGSFAGQDGAARHRAQDHRDRPGVKFSAWTFGNQVPGPTIRARVGDKIKFSMTNRSDEPVSGVRVTAAPMMHSMDFHAAMVSPQDKYRSIAPGQTIEFAFTANYPGIFMYHCGTPMILEHIASGMYGAVIVEPRAGYPTKV